MSCDNGSKKVSRSPSSANCTPVRPPTPDNMLSPSLFLERSIFQIGLFVIEAASGFFGICRSHVCMCTCIGTIGVQASLMSRRCLSRDFGYVQREGNPQQLYFAFDSAELCTVPTSNCPELQDPGGIYHQNPIGADGCSQPKPNKFVFTGEWAKLHQSQRVRPSLESMQKRAPCCRQDGAEVITVAELGASHLFLDCAMLRASAYAHIAQHLLLLHVLACFWCDDRCACPWWVSGGSVLGLALWPCSEHLGRAAGAVMCQWLCLGGVRSLACLRSYRRHSPLCLVGG